MMAEVLQVHLVWWSGGWFLFFKKNIFCLIHGFLSISQKQSKPCIRPEVLWAPVLRPAGFHQRECWILPKAKRSPLLAQAKWERLRHPVLQEVARFPSLVAARRGGPRAPSLRDAVIPHFPFHWNPPKWGGTRVRTKVKNTGTIHKTSSKPKGMCIVAETLGP